MCLCVCVCVCVCVCLCVCVHVMYFFFAFSNRHATLCFLPYAPLRPAPLPRLLVFISCFHPFNSLLLSCFPPFTFSLLTLLSVRPLQCKEIRGNLNTRLQKLDSGAFDAILLARIGTCLSCMRSFNMCSIRAYVHAPHVSFFHPFTFHTCIHAYKRILNMQTLISTNLIPTGLLRLGLGDRITEVLGKDEYGYAG